MAITQIFSELELVASFSNIGIQQRTTLYILQSETLQNGVTPYLDLARTQKLSVNRWYGAIFGGKNYKFYTDSNSAVSQLGEIVDDANNKSYYMFGFSVSELNITERLAAYSHVIGVGVDAIHETIGLWDIFQGSIDNQPTNNGNNFVEKLNLLKQSGVDVFLRVVLHYPRLWAGYQPNDVYWGAGNAELDQWGYRPETNAGSVPPCIADDVFTTKLAGKFEYIVNLAYSILGTKLKWVSPVFSTQQEWGYDFMGMYWWGENIGTPDEKWFSNQYDALFCYNPKNEVAFRAWLHGKFGTIAALNTSWGTNYTDFSNITIPRTDDVYNNGVGISSAKIFSQVFAGNRGVDLYRFMTYKLINFGNKLKAKVRAINQNILFTGEAGAWHDGLAYLRGTFDINKHSDLFDVMKGSMGVLNACNQPYDGFAYSNKTIRTKNKISAGEYSNFDLNCGGDVQNDPANYKTRLKELYLGEMNIGLQFCVVFDAPRRNASGVIDYTLGTFPKSLEVIQEVKAIIGSTMKPRPVGTTQLSVSLRQLLNDRYALAGLWSAAGGSRTNLIEITLSE